MLVLNLSGIQTYNLSFNLFFSAEKMAYKLLIFLFGLHSALTELAPGKTCFSNIT